MDDIFETKTNCEEETAYGESMPGSDTVKEESFPTEEPASTAVDKEPAESVADADTESIESLKNSTPAGVENGVNTLHDVPKHSADAPAGDMPDPVQTPESRTAEQSHTDTSQASFNQATPQQEAQQGPQYYGTREERRYYSPYPPESAETNETAQKTEKKKTGGWKRVVAAALIFGIVAGSAAYGVQYAGGRFVKRVDTVEPVTLAQTAEIKTSSASADNGVHLTNADTSIGRVSSGGTTVAEVTANAMPSLVTISTMSVYEMRDFFGGARQYTAQGAGTGIIVGQNDEELLIATNSHVVKDATQLAVGFIDENVVEAEVKGTDDEADLAIVAVKADDIPEKTMDEIKIAIIGDSDQLVLGEQIVAIGNALGYGQSVTSGYVSGFDRELELTDGMEYFTSSGLIQVDAAINSGNSGGALLNMQGELVGINEAKSSMTSDGATVDNMGYAIPINKAQPILEELMNDTRTDKYDEDEQGYLGVTCANVSKEGSELYGIPEGVCFTGIVEDGPAAEAGIKAGDVLQTFDGKKLRSYESLTERLQYYKAGEEVEITVLRAHEGEYLEETMTVTLGSKDVLDETSKILGRDY